MPNKKNAAEENGRTKSQTEPKFPYSTKPSSLRRLLQDIPKKPKPPKFDKDLLKAWGFSDAKDYSMIRVLKTVGLLNANNEPTDLYAQYMNLDTGAAALAPSIKRIYDPLFQASYTPYRESNEKLQNLFNIHSGGGERALDQQIQTFKALCEYTSFDSPGITQPKSAAAVTAAGPTPATGAQASSVVPSVNINLHIHLPENKTRRDYEAMIEDIGRYIFGKTESSRRDE